ncbi:leucine-rich repeat-containing protein kinase family protein [Limnohabitans sp. JirII-31]|uniref:leucine-rich repeat-containing protein kinase family protein n=1 Tax=Limnohabitans sp. JirII-31 TaxID=1977908 RepID=UPI000C1F1DAD|nr:leucine-rich repeat-containing protein kinase family protein [Limnohabitans sp. JirII-31]PIT80772.1 protein kinase [Limnohabitans sp. JirII-31]
MHTLAQLRAGELAGITRLQLRADLREFPQEIYALADSLEILDLSGNQLSRLPDDLPRLHRLRVIFCSDNRFTELPRVLGRCTALTMVGFKANQIQHVPAESLPPLLRWLILTDNQIETLPDALGQCTQLQKLMLAGNRLRALPALQACTRLELLRMSANQLTSLPAWLLALPALSWLAYGGNPLSAAHEAAAQPTHSLRSVPWASLQLSHVLGEGASGVIHQAGWHTDTHTQAVAVKLFKGPLTSDGLPACEMAACLHAGAHPHLIAAMGQIEGHPEHTQGLVMPLIDPSFITLAGPPSLDSCTRDVYARDTRFSVAAMLQLALGVTRAAQHLHARGILHGDLYAHNLLHNGQGEVLLGDFGAASLFDPQDTDRAHALMRIEVRAFGCLLQELVARCDALAAQPQRATALQQLVDSCLQHDMRQRPSWPAIEEGLMACLG